MKVIHINTSNLSGGAAIAAFRLHWAMLDYGVNSSFFCFDKTVNDGTVKSFPKITQIIEKILGKIKVMLFNKTKLSKKIGLFSNMYFGNDVTKYIDLNDFDVIYIHWINNAFINFKGLEKILKTNKPVYWFMHDMFPITGGCHHSFGCDGYQKKCGNCEYIKHPKMHDFSYKQLNKKIKIFKKYENLNFICPSNWLYDCTKKSVLAANHNVFHIPNLLDSKIFKVLDRKVCRDALNIPDNRKVILFGADSALINPYKGFDYLEKALNILYEDDNFDNSNVMLVLFGSFYNKEISERLPFETKFLGYIYDNYTLNLLYNCADVFCIPSVAENFPNTILEAIHCKVPIIGFNVGGIPDLVSVDTGYLAEYKNANDFAYGIKSVLNGSICPQFNKIKKLDSLSIVKKHIEIISRDK